MNCLCICIWVLLFVRKISFQIFSLLKQQKAAAETQNGSRIGCIAHTLRLLVLPVLQADASTNSASQPSIRVSKSALPLMYMHTVLAAAAPTSVALQTCSHILSDPIQPTIWFSDHLLCIITSARRRFAPRSTLSGMKSSGNEKSRTPRLTLWFLPFLVGLPGDLGFLC